MSARTEMLNLLQSRKSQYSLPGRFYSDAAFYDIDLDTIFHRRWLFAGFECEVERPGQFFTLTIGRSPIIVLRDRAGALRAFFNTCRHRGFKICEEERGKSANLACPYHQWTYDLTGKLIHAGRMHEGFDPTGIALKPIHVATVGGTLYVCLADEAPDFTPYRAVLEPYLRPHDLGNARLAHEMHVVENANWKLVMENSRECYHCAARHPELMRTFLDSYPAHDPQEDPAIAAYWEMCRGAGLLSGQANGDDFRISRLPFTEGAVSITMDGKPAVSRLLGNVPHGDIGSLRWVHYPSVFNHVLGDYAIAVRMLPLAPEQTLVTAKWLVHRDAREGRDYDLDNLIKVWAETNNQDQGLVERNQRGVNSLGYQPGPYSQETEVGVIKFVEWYCATMADALEGAPTQSPILVA